MLANAILIIHCILALAIIVLVLLQHGKGADMGAAFGSGSAGSLFGSSGAANFLSRSTGVCAALFFATSLGLTYFHAPKISGGVMSGGVMDSVTTPAAKTDAKDASAIPAPTVAPVPAAAQTPGGVPVPPAANAPVPAPAVGVPAAGKSDPKVESKSQQIPK
jgi:preprotein translocase subunit SecG